MNSSWNSNISNSSVNSTPASTVAGTISWDLITTTAICSFGLVTNFINIVVFVHPKLKDQTYKYMLANSVVQLLYLVINAMIIFYACGTLCDPAYNSLMGRLFSVYLSGFFSGLLAIYNILIELFLSFQRLMILSNKSFLRNASVLPVLFVLFVISFVYNIPNLICDRIVLVPTSDPNIYTYSSVTTDFGKSSLASVLKQVIKYIRIFLTLGVLSVLNILTAYKSRQHFEKRANMKSAFSSMGCNSKPVPTDVKSGALQSKNESVSASRQFSAYSNKTLNSRASRIHSTATNKTSESRSSMKINIMVVLISFLYIFGNLPFSILYLVSRFTYVSYFAYTLTYFALYIYSSLSIFIFYFFNNNYRNILNGYVSKIVCL